MTVEIPLNMTISKRQQSDLNFPTLLAVKTRR